MTRYTAGLIPDAVARLMRPADRRACGVSANFQNSCRSAGLPVPVPEYRFDPTRRWRLDYAWPEHKLALEVEGGVWIRGRHNRGTGFMRDIEKYNALACAGWRLLRCVPDDVRSLAILPVVAVALRGEVPCVGTAGAYPPPA
jgi:hypothetical protein